MNFLKIFLFIGMCSSLVISQQSTIKEIFLQDVFREDFNESNAYFPIEVRSGGKYAIIVDSLGYYGLGSEKSEYPVLIGWKNDLTNFELKSSIRLKDEEDWEAIQKLQGKTGQIIGIILKYNPNNQEALIFQINGVRQYRLSHLKNEKMRSLTGDWRNSENLKRDDKNEIIIRTKNNRYEFYINGKIELKKNLERFKNVLSSGNFGFYLGSKTQVMIDYLYISTTKEYAGINKLLNLTEEDAKKLIDENEKLKIDLEKEKEDAIKELKDVIQLLENELKSINKINDSLQKENKEFQPFKELIEKGEKDFMYTLTKDLKEEMEKNKVLKDENETLLDSIQILIQNQETFKLEYLKILDSVMEKGKKDTIN